MAATGEHPIDRETASTAVESHSGANAEDPRLESRRPPCSDDVEVEGGLDKHVIRRIVRAHISEVRACYNAGIAEDPELAGRVNVQFSIDAEGTVAAAVVHESTLRDAATASCIAQAVRGWKFPKPTGGGTVMVTYPFLLSAGD
jgi:TonB family protein